MNYKSIKDTLSIQSRFLRSTQLERDFDDPHALEGFVLSEQVNAYLKRILKGLRIGSGQRAWRITGDFGAGKSSFALLIANLLGRKFEDLPEDLKGLRSEFGIEKEFKPYFPILVTGSRTELSYSLLRAILYSCEKQSKELLKFRSITWIKKLLSSDGDIPDGSIAEVLISFSKEIVQSGLYSGVTLVIDELGKFLEFAAHNPDKEDIYLLQQIGEISARSGDYPILTMGILHQGFSSYADRLSETTQREWEKVGGRFDGINFSQPLSQAAVLISRAITCEFEVPGWADKTEKDMSRCVELGMYGSSVSKTELVSCARNLYPIHPTVLPVLHKFFRRFGQNERSLFSFLLSSEPHALQEFSQKSVSLESVYRLADFYDYAAENFSHRLISQSFRSHWNHIDAVIRSFPEKEGLLVSILKTVGILNVVESDELQPTKELLELALGSSVDLDESLNELCYKSHLLFNRGLKRGFSLWPNTSVNLEQSFVDASERVTSIPPIAEVVRERLDSRPIIARKHYIKAGTLRYFNVRYFTVQEFKKIGEKIAVDHPVDGSICVVLCEKLDEREDMLEWVLGKSFSLQVLIAISPPLEELKSFAMELERWRWVEKNTLELKDDRFAANEVVRQIATVNRAVDNWITQHFNLRGEANWSRNSITWVHNGIDKIPLNEGDNLQNFLSELCEEGLFYSAPKIRNELINRHALSAAASAARTRLISLILEQSEDPNLGLPEDKYPPEKSIYLSVIESGGIHKIRSGKWSIGFPPVDRDVCNLLPSMNAVVDYLEQRPDKRINFLEVFDFFRKPPFGVRDGLAILLIVVVYLEYENEIAIYEDDRFQPDVDEGLFKRLEKAPHTFEIQFCKLSELRRSIIGKLMDVVGEGSSSNQDLLTLVRPIYQFYADLPEFSKNTDSLSAKTLALRKAIVAAKEPAELIFDKIPESMGFSLSGEENSLDSKFAKEFGNSISELRRAFPNLLTSIKTSILEAFGEEVHSFEEWRSSISQIAETVVLGVTEPDLRALCLKLIDDVTSENEWLESVGSFVAKCPPSRWKDRNRIEFENRIVELATTFNRVLSTCFNQTGGLPDSAIRLAITPRNGNEKEAVLVLEASDTKRVETLKKDIGKLLEHRDQASVFALSQILLELLSEQ